MYIEGSCPACQRALSATLFSDKALVKGLTPAGHGCWGGGGGGGYQQHSRPTRLQESTPRAGRYPPTPAAAGKAMSDLISLSSNSPAGEKEKDFAQSERRKITKLAALKCVHGGETGYYKVRKQYWKKHWSRENQCRD